MKELRDQLDLSRPQLAQQTGRSIGYILKAEQYSFPRAPVALTNFYHNKLGIPIDQLNQQYRDQQRHRREHFHTYFVPRSTNTAPETLCNKWQLTPSGVQRTGGGAVGFSNYEPAFDSIISPNQYQVSKVLCVPASAVYFAEKSYKISSAILEAMDDLLTYADSGRMYADLPNYDEAQQVHIGLDRVSRELRHVN